MKEFTIIFIFLSTVYLIYRLIRFYEKELSKLEHRIDLLKNYISNTRLIPLGSKTVIIRILEGQHDQDK